MLGENPYFWKHPCIYIYLYIDHFGPVHPPDHGSVQTYRSRGWRTFHGFSDVFMPSRRSTGYPGDKNSHGTIGINFVGLSDKHMLKNPMFLVKCWKKKHLKNHILFEKKRSMFVGVKNALRSAASKGTNFWGAIGDIFCWCGCIKHRGNNFLRTKRQNILGPPRDLLTIVKWQSVLSFSAAVPRKLGSMVSRWFITYL